MSILNLSWLFAFLRRGRQKAASPVKYYTADDIVTIRAQMRDAISAARHEVLERGVKVHPRIFAARKGGANV